MKLILSSLFLAVLMLGCSSPKTSYYRLSSSPISAQTANKVRLMVGPVTIPVGLDRPQLTTQNGGNEVQVYEYHRWAGSLKGDIGQVLASTLARDLGASEVWSFSQSTQAQFDYQVLIDVQNLESSEKSGVVLDVLWAIKPSSSSGLCKGSALTGRSLVNESVGGAAGFDALVAAQSRAFSKVGDDIAKRIPVQGCKPVQ